MPLGNPVWAPSEYRAGGQIEAHRAVKFSSSSGHLIRANEGQEVYAVAAKDHQSGDLFEGWLLVASDIVELRAGSNIDMGAPVMSNDFGRCIAYSGSSYVIGFALEPAVTNDIVPIATSQHFRPQTADDIANGIQVNAAIDRGQAVKRHSSGRLTKCNTAREYAYAVADRDLPSMSQFRGNVLVPGQRVIALAGADIAIGRNVMVDGNGEFVQASGVGHVLGFVTAAVSDNDIFEFICTPYWKNS